jgi:hypothetical protein
MGQAYGLLMEINEVRDAETVRNLSKNLPRIYEDEGGAIEAALY